MRKTVQVERINLVQTKEIKQQIIEWHATLLIKTAELATLVVPTSHAPQYGRLPIQNIDGASEI